MLCPRVVDLSATILIRYLTGAKCLFLTARVDAVNQNRARNARRCERPRDSAVFRTSQLWRRANVRHALRSGAAHWHSHGRRDGVIARELEHGDGVAQRGGLELKGYVHLSARRDIYR